MELMTRIELVNLILTNGEKSLSRKENLSSRTENNTTSNTMSVGAVDRQIIFPHHRIRNALTGSASYFTIVIASVLHSNMQSGVKHICPPFTRYTEATLTR